MNLDETRKAFIEAREARYSAQKAYIEALEAYIKAQEAEVKAQKAYYKAQGIYKKIQVAPPISPQEIKALRLGRSETQVQFAKAVEVNARSVRNWESGATEPEDRFRKRLWEMQNALLGGDLTKEERRKSGRQCNR